jgi:F-type H+-transporting ATPase subunit a
MKDLTELAQWTFEVGGVTLVFNQTTIIMTLIIMALIILFGWLATKDLGYIPNPFQVIAEMFVGFFHQLCVDALDEDMAKTYYPMITCLFIFLLICNSIGIFPYMEEPTKDLNTPLGLGIMGFFIAHYAGIRAKGIGGYVKEYFQPIFFMAPLNIIGELAKVVSISFRLFGNIMGGAIIILVVSHLVYGLIIPPFLYAFFCGFIGLVQAFVFTMLTLVYISVQVK